MLDTLKKRIQPQHANEAALGVGGKMKGVYPVSFRERLNKRTEIELAELSKTNKR